MISSAALSYAKGLQNIAAETTDFSKKLVEANAAYVEQLLNVKSTDEAIQIQSEYAKSAYENLVPQTTRISELCTTLVKDSFKPAEEAFARFQAAARGRPWPANRYPAKEARLGTSKAPDSSHDRSLQEWICQENIKNMRAQLAETNDERRRATLSTLLAEQEAILEQLRSQQGEG